MSAQLLRIFSGAVARIPLKGRFKIASSNTTICSQSVSAEGTSWFRAVNTSTGGRFSKDSSSEPKVEETQQNLGEMIKPTDFQKKVLVWGHLYKTVDEVPDRVSSMKMKKARDLFRIRVNIMMGVCTLAGCVLMIFWGRHLRDSGDSLDARGQAQIEAWARQGEQERAEKKRREEMSK